VTDVLGQLRVDNPQISAPPGLGSNIFKDRGAVERADFNGPTAALINPLDNDPGGFDRNRQFNRVQLVGQQVTDFRIQLNEGIGVGVDDATVVLDRFTIQRTIGGSTVTLTPGEDFSLAYDSNSDVARLIPADGVWINGVYTITLDNSVSPIKDLAGNALQPNEPPLTQFVVELTDTVSSAWQNPLNRFDVNADGTVTGLDVLMIINRLLAGQIGPLPIVPDVPPYLDVSGDSNLSPVDALQIINLLNAAALAAPAAAMTASPAASGTPATPLSAASAPSAPAAVDASAVAFSITVDSTTAGAAMASTSIDVMSAAAQPAAAPSAAAPVAAQSAATADVWAAEDWDVADDQWDTIASELLEEPDELCGALA
jgi:hypothetical protein